MPFELALKNEARAIGFSLAGIAPACEADGFHQLQSWLARGFAGSMNYMHRHAVARRHPASILPEVRSVVMVALEYGQQRRRNDRRSDGQAVLKSDAGARLTGKIARYARGPDYHGVLRKKLKDLLTWLQRRQPDCRGRAVVDTAPLLERDFARRAGLGWIGKNTMLINKHRGSYFFLGALLLDLELTPDTPHVGFHCGTCTACLDACPTGAFTAPGQLDARRCISYLTIELRGRIPEPWREPMGDWLFGCDVCQEVCPWNRRDESMPDLVDPATLIGMTDADFRRQFGGTALERTRRAGLVRNAAIVLGNAGEAAALPALRQALGDGDESVREAAAWAIGQIENRISPAGRTPLTQ